MTDKERLENMSPIGFDLNGDVLLRNEDYHWLLEQAEKVEYWMKQHRKRCNELEDAYFKIQLIENQNKRYREALKNIYELAEYDEYDNTLEQIVSEVEKALEESE